MSKPGYALLQDVVMDDAFPELDLALRRGRHIDRDDAAWYSLLCDAQEQLEIFYRRYGCELIHKTDGYFYLLPTGDKLSRKQLSPGDMLVGQALALLYLDPAAIERGGFITHEELVAQLSSVLGSDVLIAAFNPTTKKKKYDERIAQKNVRNRVAEAARRLATLGFVELSDDEKLRLRPPLLRFAEPVRAASEPAEALAKLVAQGEVALVPEDEANASEHEGDTGDEFAPERDAAVADASEEAPSLAAADLIEPVFAASEPVREADLAMPLGAADVPLGSSALEPAPAAQSVAEPEHPAERTRVDEADPWEQIAAPEAAPEPAPDDEPELDWDQIAAPEPESFQDADPDDQRDLDWDDVAPPPAPPRSKDEG